MGRIRAVGISAAVVGLGALAWLLLREAPGPLADGTVVQQTKETSSSGAATALRVGGEAAAAQAAPQPVRALAEPEVAPVDYRRATAVIGRCVADDGKPLAGCRLSLRILRTLPEVDPALHTSGADGRFWVPVPTGVALEL